MELLTLHRAILLADVEIRTQTNSVDDYLLASTEMLFSALWESAPGLEYRDDLWNVSLGGDVSGSWIAKSEEMTSPHHRYILLSTCNHSMVIAHDVQRDEYAIITETVPPQILPKNGDTLRSLIADVVNRGDFHDDELNTCPNGRKDEIDPELFRAPVKVGFTIKKM